MAAYWVPKAENIAADFVGAKNRGYRLLAEFLPKRKIINIESQCKMLKELWRAIQNRIRGLLISGVCCTKMPDGTPPLVHAYYLNSSSGEFFSNLHQMATTCFSSSRHFWRPESEEQPNEKRRSEPDEKFDGELSVEGINKLVPLYENSLNSHGDYLEK